MTVVQGPSPLSSAAHMSAADPPEHRPLLDAEDGPEEGSTEEFFAPPPVVVVMVTHDPGPTFEASLASIAAQDYPGLSVLIVDNGSAEDPTERVAAVLPDAFVR